MAIEAKSHSDNESAVSGVMLDNAEASEKSIRRRGGAIGQASTLDNAQKKLASNAAGAQDTTVFKRSTGALEAQKLPELVGGLIETVEAQAAIALLIVVDFLVAILRLHVHSRLEVTELQTLNTRLATGTKSRNAQVDVDSPVLAEGATAVILRIALRAMDAVSSFTVVVFLLEIALLLFTFRRQFFTHIGYTADLTIVCASIAMEVSVQSRAIRLLVVMRLWRIVRVVAALVDRERVAHEATLFQLETERTRVLQLQLERQAAQESLKREYESRAGIERMLQGYKDEADTLREALNIAAHAVAEATMFKHTENTPEYSDNSDRQAESRLPDETAIEGEYFDYYADKGANDDTEADGGEYAYDARTGISELYPEFTSSVDAVSDNEDDLEFTDARDRQEVSM